MIPMAVIPITSLPPIHYLFFPSLGPMEIAILFLVVLIVFGPGKLPDVFKALGDGVRQFKKASKDVTDELTADADKGSGNNLPSQSSNPSS